MKRTKIEYDFFEKEVIPLRGLVYSYILNRLDDKQLADDICQICFIKAWKNLGQLKDKNLLKVWLLKITRHTMVRYLMVKNLEPFEKKLDFDEYVYNYAVSDTDPGFILEKECDQKNLMSCFDSLTALEKHVVTRYYIEGELLKDVAAELGMNYNTIRTISKRGLKKIKDRLNLEKAKFDRETGGK